MQRWLKCNLERGMFSDEMVVTYPATGTEITTVFVPSSDVRGRAGETGKVRVMVAKRGAETLAILPTSYRDSVAVSEHDLSDSP